MWLEWLRNEYVVGGHFEERSALGKSAPILAPTLWSRKGLRVRMIQASNETQPRAFAHPPRCRQHTTLTQSQRVYFYATNSHSPNFYPDPTRRR